MSYIRKTKFKDIKRFGLDFFGRLYRKSKFKKEKIENNKQIKNKKGLKIKKVKNRTNIVQINRKLTQHFYKSYRRLVYRERSWEMEKQFKTLIKRNSRMLKKKPKTKLYFRFHQFFRQNTSFVTRYSVYRAKKPFLEKLFFFKQFQWFYGKMSRVRVKKLFLKFQKSKKVKVNELILLLEFKLDVVLFKCGFFISVLQARNMIRKGYIYVNNKIITNNNFILNGNDLISIKKKSRIDSYKHLIFRIKAKNLFYYQPRHAEINYSIMSFIVLKEQLKWNELKFPILNLNLLSIKSVFKFL